MSNNSPLKFGEIAEPGNSKDLPKGRWWIVPINPSEQAYWRSRNPLLGYKQPATADKTARVTAVIHHVKLLIQHRIDQGERYFTEYSKHQDLLEMRQEIVAHFRSQSINLNIRKDGYIFVFGTLNGIATNV
jgi:hypothetical protein